MKKNLSRILILIFLLGLSPVNFSNAEGIATRLKGRILLQVESNGEAWYINTSDEKRYYLSRPDDAFDLMRNLGIGISNNDINKIQIADENLQGTDSDNDGLSDMIENAIKSNPLQKDTDNDGYSDKEELISGYNPAGSGKINFDTNFSRKQAGKLLLQVEQNGEAWYVNPSDNKRYFLGRPNDAFNVMRELGLGISNSDLSKIEESRSATDEDPTEIMTRLYRSSLLKNDVSFSDSHSYCDEECSNILKDQLNLSLAEYNDLSRKIFLLNEDLEINTLDVKLTSQTETEAKFDISLDYSPLGYSSTVTISGQDTLIKVGNKWMKNEKNYFYYSIPLCKNYMKFFADLKKCQEKGEIKFDITQEGGIFKIDDQDHPLFGLYIRFPKLKEKAKISISCYSPGDITYNFFYGSLPIHITADKDFSEIIYEEDQAPPFGLDINKVEESEYANIYPMIAIPYYADAIDEDKSIFTAIVTDTDNDQSGVITSVLNPEEKVSRSYFSHLWENWSLQAMMMMIKYGDYTN